MLRNLLTKYHPYLVIYVGAIILKNDDKETCKYLVEYKNLSPKADGFIVLERILSSKGYDRNRINSVLMRVKQYLLNTKSLQFYKDFLNIDFITRQLVNQIDASKESIRNTNFIDIMNDFAEFHYKYSEAAFNFDTGGLIAFLVTNFNDMYKNKYYDKIYSAINSKGSVINNDGEELNAVDIRVVKHEDKNSGFDYKRDMEAIYVASVLTYPERVRNFTYEDIFNLTDTEHKAPDPYYSIVDEYLNSQLEELYLTYSNNKNKSSGGEPYCRIQGELEFKKILEHNPYKESSWKLRRKPLSFIFRLTSKDYTFIDLENTYNSCLSVDSDKIPSKNMNTLFPKSDKRKFSFTEIFMYLVEGVHALRRLESYCNDKGINFFNLDSSLFMSINPIMKYDNLEDAIKYYPLTLELEEEVSREKLLDKGRPNGLLCNNESFFLGTLNIGRVKEGKYNLKTIKTIIAEEKIKDEEVQKKSEEESNLKTASIGFRLLLAAWVRFITSLNTIAYNPAIMANSSKALIRLEDAGTQVVDNPGDLFNSSISLAPELMDCWFKMLLGQQVRDTFIPILSKKEIEPLALMLMSEDDYYNFMDNWEFGDDLPPLSCPSESNGIFLTFYRKALLKVLLNWRLDVTRSYFDEKKYEKYEAVSKGILKFIPTEISSIDDSKLLKTDYELGSDLDWFMTLDDGSIVEVDDNFYLTNEELTNGNISYLNTLNSIYKDLVDEYRDEINRCNKFIDSIIEESKSIGLRLDISSPLPPDLKAFGDRMILDDSYEPITNCSAFNIYVQNAINNPNIKEHSGFFYENGKPKVVYDNCYLHRKGRLVKIDSRAINGDFIVFNVSDEYMK